jgi:hypothetical protein
MAQEEIFDTDGLYRRFPKQYIHDDGTISPGAFQNTSGTNDMSVDLARLTTPKQTASNSIECGVVCFSAGFARRLNQEVLHTPEDSNHAHSTVRGKKTKGVSRKLAVAAQIVLYPQVF